MRQSDFIKSIIGQLTLQILLPLFFIIINQPVFKWNPRTIINCPALLKWKQQASTRVRARLRTLPSPKSYLSQSSKPLQESTATKSTKPSEKALLEKFTKARSLRQARPSPLRFFRASIGSTIPWLRSSERSPYYQA